MSNFLILRSNVVCPECYDEGRIFGHGWPYAATVWMHLSVVGLCNRSRSAQDGRQGKQDREVNFGQLLRYNL